MPFTNHIILHLQYYLEKNLEARKRELEREAELEEKSPKAKAKSKMSKVRSRVVSHTCKNCDLYTFVRLITIERTKLSIRGQQAEKEARKKQKMQSFQAAKQKSKGLKNAKRWN